VTHEADVKSGKMLGDLFRRIGYSFSIDFSPRGQFMLLASAFTHDVHNFYSVNQERIADERPVTAPRNRFSAHDHCLLLLRSSDQLINVAKHI